LVENEISFVLLVFSPLARSIGGSSHFDGFSANVVRWREFFSKPAPMEWKKCKMSYISSKQLAKNDSMLQFFKFNNRFIA
jgi:hypothetical protein